MTTGKLLLLPTQEPRPVTWERKEGEPEHLWTLFLMYRDQAYPYGPAGPFKARSLEALANVSGILYSEILRHCADWAWIQRAGAWDNYVQAAKDKQELEDGIEKFRSKYQRLLAKLFQITESEFDKLLARATTLADFNALEPKDLIALVKFSFDAEQKLQGEAPSVESGEGWDLEKLTPQELETLRSLHKKATGS